MKKTFFIGLGGSGGKIISKLYERLNTEGPADAKNEVSCIAIDTDKDELAALSLLGIDRTIRISAGIENVGQAYNRLKERDDDVSDWCPTSENETAFFGSSVDDGASQLRMKSRLMLANFLKTPNNTLDAALSDFLKTGGAQKPSQSEPPRIVIASSLAGGTGSGIFIQIALYIKNFFRERKVNNAKIYGFFACPELYEDVVDDDQIESIYANAYAIVRELNAFNLICGSQKTDAYGANIDLNIEISSECEGRLFTKDNAGRYSEKPYDAMYFIDKVNALSKIRGGLNEYYKAMADMIYCHIYTEISGKILTNESNELKDQSLAPTAIYGSAGASTLEYPFDGILKYFSNRAVYESINDTWTEIDQRWNNQVYEKNIASEETGVSYIPTKEERATHFMENFEELAYKNSLTANGFSFLKNYVNRGEDDAVEKLVGEIRVAADNKIKTCDRIAEIKFDTGLSTIDMTRDRLLQKVDANHSDRKEKKISFHEITSQEDKLDEYCQRAMYVIGDLSITFANQIFCENANIRETCDSSEFGIINGLLYNKTTKEWTHPVAARYLLYKLKKEINEIIARSASIDTAADDIDDFYNYIVSTVIKKQKSALSGDSNSVSNEQIINSTFQKITGKKSCKKFIEDFFTELKGSVSSAEQRFVDALIHITLVRVAERLDRLISEYESFFDNIEEYLDIAQKATITSEKEHDENAYCVYVCANSHIKPIMYNEVKKNINLQQGPIASEINRSIFATLRDKAAKASVVNAKMAKERASKKQAEITQGFEDLFYGISSKLQDSLKTDNGVISRAFDKNVFQAMLAEYTFMNIGTERENDVVNYNNADIPEAKNNVDNFINEKFMLLTEMAAPFLKCNIVDTYNALFDQKKKRFKKKDVSKVYRYISHNSEVEKYIRTNMTSGNIYDYYNELSTNLPDSMSGSADLSYRVGDSIDSRKIICYSTIHCLQPYQIESFDEAKNGKYYKYYSDRIKTMEETGILSITPHLDKRWHKHGFMPYVNVAKEMEKHYEVAKAFLYALLYGKIGYEVKNGFARIIYEDRQRKIPAQTLFYNDDPIPYNRINRAMYWLADQDSLITSYAARLDEKLDEELEKMLKYSDTIQGYNAALTTRAMILKVLRKCVFQPKRVVGALNGGETKIQKKKDIGLLELAWILHVAEENEKDKNYSEMLIEVLVDIIKKYSIKPFGTEDSMRRGDRRHEQYIHVLNNTVEKFLEDYEAYIKEDIKAADFDYDVNDDEVLLDPTVEEETYDEIDEGGYLSDDYLGESENIPSLARKVSASVSSEERYQWAKAEIERCINS